MRSKTLVSCTSWLFASGLVLGGLSAAWGQGTETEPNNTCQTAQALGKVSLPFSITGNLESPPPPGDVDFLKFIGTPNGVVIVDLEGAATGQGTLDDPFLGLFDSNCQLLAVDDDGGDGRNSRLGFVVPADGVFILAVTSCCDDTFATSFETGSYRLTLNSGGVIAGSVRDGLGNALDPNLVAAFTPSGKFAAFATVDDSKGTYELAVRAGVYRVVASGVGARVWHRNQPTFLQANDITVGADQRITGIDFTLVGRARVTPRLNQDNYVAGDTLRLDLVVQNPAASPASIIVSVMADIPAEPGIDPESFCCFVNTLGVVPATSLTLGPRSDSVVANFATYQVTGNEVPGTYDVCVNVIQDGISSTRCSFFTFGESSIVPAGDQGPRTRDQGPRTRSKIGSKKRP